MKKSCGTPGGITIQRIGAIIFFTAACGLNLYWVVMGDKLSLWTQVAIVPITVILAGCGLIMGADALAPRGRARRYRMGLWALLAYYLCILSVLLFFGGLFHIDRGYGGAMNLEPLYTIRNYLRFYQRTGSFVSIANLLGNVVILIPLGILLPVLFRPMRRFWIFLPFAAVAAVGVEMVQWFTGTGVADIDDSILNFAGSALGYWVTRIVQIAAGHLSKRPR